MRTVLFLVLILSSQVLRAQAGILDPSFGNGGLSITSHATLSDIANDVVIQPDGKFIATGSLAVPGGYATVLARYDTEGILDSTFGTNGIAIADLDGEYDIASTCVLTGTGEILICGASDDRPMIARYLANGTLDTSFDGDGVLIDTLWPNGLGYGLAQQADGRLLIFGQRNEGSGRRLSVQRRHTDGTLDTSFDGDGYTMTDLPNVNDKASSIALQADGKVVLGGSIGANSLEEGLALVRYNTDGSLDNSFSGDGIWTYDVPNFYYEGVNTVIVQSDGKIVAGGSKSNGLNLVSLLLRLNANGTPDLTFSGDGFVHGSPIGGVGWMELLQQPDGKLLAFGIAGDQLLFILARYLSDGTLDTTFGTNGYTVTAVGNEAYASTFAFMNDGRILAAGGATPNGYQDFVFACYGNDVGGTSTAEVKSSTRLLASPNPTSDLVYLRMPAPTEGVLNGEVLDTQGRVVRSWSAPYVQGVRTVDLAGLPSGSYVLRCELPDGFAHVNVVKY